MRAARDQGRGGDGAAEGGCRNPSDAVHHVFGVLGKRWTGLLLASLMAGPGHFAELRRAVPGISERMLSERLSELVEAGLVRREVHEGPPLRVSYALTDAGLALRPALAELTRWAETHLAGPGQCPGLADG
ncbi:helix-turn-helix domain-containing protein [Streptomyces sp. DSM 44915]|uniref:Helix-turn-helix domain-containing protein n=1 Tax=Streptomyces chisholmiae TaxID=3075540 RepID=A0ABU2JQE0_9ACTN|nr:helix-turn-helix domain-containing protein [Streptomyces sp. DSM 44915]MDT0266953.1 helix-turn-helix domain-containing protein [Streptomyces sp. DSM 44915]